MTSASELFYQRRSRVGRAIGGDLWPEPSSTFERSFDQSHNRRHQHQNHINHHPNSSRQHDVDDCDSFRRYPHVRHPCHRFSVSEHGSVRHDQNTSQFVPRDNVSLESSSDSSRSNLYLNNRLPGTVLRARARLLERLGGVSPSESRHGTRGAPDRYNRVIVSDDNLRVIYGVDWGAGSSTLQYLGVSPFMNRSFQTEDVGLMQEHYKKKPPGLTPEALNSLQVEVFDGLRKGIEDEVSRVSNDCSICLESFVDGDVLIRLTCKHRFHSTCLSPWVQTCGDCPYCRADIILSRQVA